VVPVYNVADFISHYSPMSSLVCFMHVILYTCKYYVHLENTKEKGNNVVISINKVKFKHRGQVEE